MEGTIIGISKSTLLIWFVLGLIVGIAAKYILPGKDPGGLLTTSLTGIAGSFIGGALANYFGISNEIGSINPLSIIIALVGALILLIALRLLKFLI